MMRTVILKTDVGTAFSWPAETVAGWYVHRGVRLGTRSGWAVSHPPTGLKIPAVIPTRRQARALARALTRRFPGLAAAKTPETIGVRRNQVEAVVVLDCGLEIESRAVGSYEYADDHAAKEG